MDNILDMEDKITLDKKTFKVLSSDTRIEILKYLEKRRMTLTELSERLKMSVSTVKEHLDSMSSAELIEQKDEGRKWKYYELTRKGRNIMNPVDKKVFIVLALSLFAMTAGFYSLMDVQAPMMKASTLMESADTATNGGLLRAPQAYEEMEPPNTAQEAAGIPWMEFTVIHLSVLVFGLALGYVITKRHF